METECIHCDGKGTVLDVIGYKSVTCPTCNGSCYVEAAIDNYKERIVELEEEKSDIWKEVDRRQRRVNELEAEKCALIAELVFTHKSKRTASQWQEWLDEGIDRALAKAKGEQS